MRLVRSLAAALLLGGCVSTTDSGSTVTVPGVTVPIPGSAAETITSIQTYTQLACGFLPAVSFLTTLLGQSGAVNTAQEYAKAICDAVGPKQQGFSTRRAGHGSVNGVRVVGSYVR